MSEQDTQHNRNDDLIGKQIGQFKVLEEIGRGGMATVYRATQQSINRDVALKVLPRTFLHDPGFFERFEREVEVIAHLEHPHIVPIYDYGELDGMPYIAMRFLSGGTLRRLIRGGTTHLRDLARPISQVAQALDHAHQEGIIHRDLKPGNVLLDKGNNAYLSDFGIARVLNSDLTGSAIIGTPSYMSPEQANGDPLDGRSDVYSLGIVVFELITGTEPFQANTPIAMLLKQINERVPSLTAYRDNIPEAVDRVIAKATEKNPADRYGSPGEMAAAFEAAVRGLPEDAQLPDRVSDDDMPTTAAMPASDNQPTVTPPHIPTIGTRPNTPPETQAATPQLDGSATKYVTSQSFEEAQTQKRRVPVWGYMVALLALVGVVGAVVISLSPGEIPAAAAVPQYADDIQIVEGDGFAVGLPSGLRATADDTWADGDETVRVRIRAAETVDAGRVTTAAQDYDDQAEGELIDQTDPINGVIRYSYRLADGQLDVYFAAAGERVMIVELFASDSVGDSYNRNFENILHSVRVAPGDDASS